MKPTIDELKKSLKQLMSEPDPPLRLDPRETAPEIKNAIAQSVRDAALLALEKYKNSFDAGTWKTPQNSPESVTAITDRLGRTNLSEIVDGLQIEIFTEKNSSLSVEVFDEAYLDKAYFHGAKPIPDREFELKLIQTNSRSEIVNFAQEHSIFERRGINRNEFAQLVIERLQGMASKIDLQSAVQLEEVVNEPSEIDLPPKVSVPIAVETEKLELVHSESAVVDSSSTSWLEALKSELDKISGSKIQMFSGANKAYEQVDSIVTLYKLETSLGQKLQQGLENPNQLKGSIRISMDGENIYHVKDGAVLNNTHDLKLESNSIIQSTESNIIEISQTTELSQDQKMKLQDSINAQVLPENAAFSIPIEQKTFYKLLGEFGFGDIVPDNRSKQSTSEPVNFNLEEKSVAQQNVSASEENILGSTSKTVESPQQNIQIEVPQTVEASDQGQDLEHQDNTDVLRQDDFSVSQDESLGVTPVAESQHQNLQSISSKQKEKVISQLSTSQNEQINLLEQKLATQTQPLNTKVNQWLGALSQIAKGVVKEVKQKSLQFVNNSRNNSTQVPENLGNSKVDPSVVAEREANKLPPTKSKQFLKNFLQQASQKSQQVVSSVNSINQFKRNREVATTAIGLLDHHYQQTQEHLYQAEGYKISLEADDTYVVSDKTERELLRIKGGGLLGPKIINNQMNKFHYLDFERAHKQIQQLGINGLSNQPHQRVKQLGSLAPQGDSELINAIKTQQVKQIAKNFLAATGINSWDAGDKGNYSIQSFGDNDLEIRSTKDNRGTILKLSDGKIESNLAAKDFAYFQQLKNYSQVSESSLRFPSKSPPPSTVVNDLASSNLRNLASLIAAKNVLDTFNLKAYESESFRFEKQNDVVVVKAKDGRGEIARMQNGQVTGRVSDRDVIHFSSLNQMLNPTSQSNSVLVDLAENQQKNTNHTSDKSSYTKLSSGIEIE